MAQTDSPVTGFRPFFNPATGEWVTYTAIAADSDGQLVRFNWRSVPGAVITEHIHPRQEKRFTIIAGQAHFTLNGEPRVAGPGETIIVPAGVPHSEGNPGPAEIEGVVELRPALHTKEWHEALAGLVADGKTTPRGAPKNPLQLGATFRHFRHESRITSPPIWAQNLMLPPLWALAEQAASRGLVAGRPSAAQDANVIVVTAATAARYGLRSVAGLARVAPRLVFGGPPECPQRIYCLLGLKQVYGLRFRVFIPLDAGGPLTLQALQAGDISVALLFSTDPAITADHLVVLADDRGLQPAENVVPLVRRDAVARYGPRLLAVLDTVSARLTTSSLRALDARVELRGEDPRRVAESWLRTQGLAPTGEVSH